MANSYHSLIDASLDKLADRRTQEFVDRYAVKPDGTLDVPLASRIDREVHRRAAMGKELDVYEPIRWTGYSFLLSTGLGAGIKLATDKAFSKPALITLAITTALSSGIQLFRLFPRYDAGLKGGLDTALAMQHFDESRDYPTPGDPQAGSGWASRVEAARAATPAISPGL